MSIPNPSSAPQQTPVVLRSPSTAAAALPYLLGFTPTESLVTVVTTETAGTEKVLVVGRFDLPDPGADVQAYAQQVSDSLTRTGEACGVIVFAIGDGPDARHDARYQDAALSVTDALEDAGVSVKDALFTDNDRVWSFLCEDPTCPCQSGLELTEQLRDEVATDFVAAGVAPVGTRDDLSAEWTQEIPDEVATAIRTALTKAMPAHTATLVKPLETRAPALLEQVQHTIARLREPGPLSTDDTAACAATFAIADIDIKARDLLVWQALRSQPEDQRILADNLTAVARVMPVANQEAAATTVAVTRYALGDGARANIAAGQALAANPDARLAQMVIAAQSAGLPPQVMVQTLASMSRDQVLGVQPLDVAPAAPAPVPPAPAPSV